VTAIPTTKPTEAPRRPRGHDWEQAGAVWGHPAAMIVARTGQHHAAATSTWCTIAREPTL
jgi:hypothetical protein